MARSMSATDAQIAEHFGSRLESLGFRGVRPRRWVRSSKQPIREIVQITSSTGSDPIATWGISFDFVPHEEAEHPAWHRTDASARFDLRVDPLDWADQKAARKHSFTADDKSIARAAKATITEACAWFDRIDDVPSTIALFDEARARAGARFDFEHYPQQRLAHAFVLARSGQPGRAWAEMAIWIDGYGRNLPTANKVAFHDLLSDVA